MAELKALSQDVLKNTSDIANYNSEFKTLQVQLYQMSQTKFNGVSFLGRVQMQCGGSPQDVTVSIYTSAGGERTRCSINKSMLLSALTIDAASATFSSAAWTDNMNTSGTDKTFAVSLSSKAGFIRCTVAVFTQALKISLH